MILETLYKRTRTGAIQFWKVEYRAALDGAQIKKTSGQLGTDKPLTHVEPIQGKNIGKTNETTPLQQAEFDAQSDWKRKHDEGYKSLTDLKIEKCKIGHLKTEGYYSYPGCGLMYQQLDYCLELVLPKFNTDASGEVKPQLAPSKPFVKGKLKYPRQYEKKLDGNRVFCRIKVDKENDKKSVTAVFTSRSGKPINTLSHLVHQLLTSVLLDLEETIILDGEIYLHGLTLEEINEAIKKENENTKKLEFWVFDLPLHGGNQEQRSITVSDIVKNINSRYIHFETTNLVNSDDEVIKLHDEDVQNGFEGAMLKSLDGMYCSGQRNPAWTKVKMFDDNEFIVTGFRLGQRGVEDIVFKCKCDTAVEGYPNEFEVKMSGTRESKQKLYDKIDELIGKKLTVKHFGLSKYGIPNLPIGKAFRDE